MAENLASLFTTIGGMNVNALKANQYGPVSKSMGVLKKGDIIQFTYAFAKAGQDPNPLVLITDPNFIYTNPQIARRNPGQYVRGLNLHWLSFPVIKKLLQVSGMNACNNPTFSYQNISADKYIVTSFRQYKKQGLRRVKVLNCDYILNVMGIARAIDPQELEAIRQTMKEQLNKTINQNIPGTSEL